MALPELEDEAGAEVPPEGAEEVPLSEPRVSGPTTPSTSRPLLRWESLTALSVSGPNTPSTARFAPLLFRADCRSLTASPREPQRSFSLDCRAVVGAVVEGAAGAVCVAGAGAGAAGAVSAGVPAKAVPTRTVPRTAAPPRPVAARRVSVTGVWARPVARWVLCLAMMLSSFLPSSVRGDWYCWSVRPLGRAAPGGLRRSGRRAAHRLWTM